MVCVGLGLAGTSYCRVKKPRAHQVPRTLVPWTVSPANLPYLRDSDRATRARFIGLLNPALHPLHAPLAHIRDF